MRQTMKKLVLMMVIFLTWSNSSVHCQEGSGSEEFLEDYIIEDNFVIEGEDYVESDFCSEGSGITNKLNIICIFKVSFDIFRERRGGGPQCDAVCLVLHVSL